MIFFGLWTWPWRTKKIVVGGMVRPVTVPAFISSRLNQQLYAQSRRLPAAAGLQDGAQDFVAALIGSPDGHPLAQWHLDLGGRLGKPHPARPIAGAHFRYARHNLHVGRALANHRLHVKPRRDALENN